MGRGRGDLLEAILDDVAAKGLADRSLREIAEAVGSSHRMLIYHFGSRDGLVSAIVEHVERTQRDAMAATSNDVRQDPAEVARSMWRRTSSEPVRPFVTLFFESVAYAARSGGADFTTAWIDDAVAAARALGAELSPAEARLGIAVIRGLLIDVVTTGDDEPATEALEVFLERWPPGGHA